MARASDRSPSDLPDKPGEPANEVPSEAKSRTKARLVVVQRSLSAARLQVVALMKFTQPDHPTRARSPPPPAPDVTPLIVLENRRPFAISPSCDLYKAQHQDAGVVVIRRIRFQDDTDSRVAESKLQTTAAWLVLARNEHVIPYLGVCDFEGGLCLVSPLASGGDLKTHLQTHPECDRMSLIRQVANGLAYLHHAFLVHGNIHTRNVLLEGDTVKLSDFGLRRLIPEDGTTSMRPAFAREKALYCAPELHGGAALSTSCDVYSFGMLAFHVYSDREPMMDAYPQAIQAVVALLHGRRPDRQEITRLDFTERLWDLSQRCWAQDATTRPSMAAVLQDLQRESSKSSRLSWAQLRRK